MPRLAAAVAASSIAAAAALTAAAYADHHEGGDHSADAVTMFNGEDLTGWKINENPDSWSVVDGAIKSNGERSHLFYVGTTDTGETADTLDRPFRDFVFTCQVKTEPNSNAGIYFHTRFQDSGWPAGGFEAQVNNTYESDPKKTGSLYAVSNVLEAPAKDGEWFPYEIRVEGNHVRISAAGKPLVDYYEPAGVTPGKDFDRALGAGTFALQAHDPGSVVYFKDLKVQRLN